jgi:hypothetical protein
VGLCDILDEAQVAASAAGCDGAFLTVGRVEITWKFKMESLLP